VLLPMLFHHGKIGASGCGRASRSMGNRCQPVFFCEADYAAYMALLAEGCRRRGLGLCLISNSK
jgi:hypothetical protein